MFWPEDGNSPGGCLLLLHLGYGLGGGSCFARKKKVNWHPPKSREGFRVDRADGFDLRVEGVTGFGQEIGRLWSLPGPNMNGFTQQLLFDYQHHPRGGYYMLLYR